MRICRKCNTERDISFFPKDKAYKDGMSRICKQCHREKCKNYEKNNKEKIKKRKQKNYQNNREEILKKSINYYKINKDIIDLYNKEYYKNNKDKLTNISKEYYIKNKDSILEKMRYEYSKIDEEERQRKNFLKKNWYSKNKKKISQKRMIRHSERMSTEPLYKLTSSIRISIRQSLNNKGFKKFKKTESILGISIQEFKSYLESKFESWMNWQNKGLYNGEFNYGWDLDHIIPISTAKTEEEILKLNHYTNFQPLCSKINRDIKKNLTDYELFT